MARKDKHNAELWDKMHYMFRDYNDRMVHVVLTYDYLIDEEALKNTVICFVERIPVLHSSFVSNVAEPYWEEKDYTFEDILTVIDEPDDLDKTVEDFIMQYLPPESNVQIKVALINKDGKSTLCIIENHMCMDGGDLKSFLAAFCEGYSELVEEGKSPVGLIRQGSRSFDEVYSDLSPAEKRAAKQLYKNVSNRDKHGFPFSPDSDGDKSFIVKRKISKERFAEIYAAGKSIDATVNDVLVGNFLHSLYDVTDFDKSEEIVVSCAIDLRRYINDLSDLGYTNHTAYMPCSIPGRGRDIKESIEFAKISARKNKDDRFMGLYGLPLLKIAYKAMPFLASENVIKIGYSNPLLSMSNIGVLNTEKLSLCGNPPVDGFMTGAVKYKPFALMSATSLNGEMTLCICERGNADDKKLIEIFFDYMDQHFDEFVDLCK
ncbi:MAG: hypothetical protein IKT04_03810 [Clostridia bacterium]|nr:hypothetical protein [Clostridia bacterium]